MYQKLQKYTDDKKYLFEMYQADKCSKKQPLLNFQNEKARLGFLKSIPKYIMNEIESQNQGTSDKSETGGGSFLLKFEQIKEAIRSEIELYEYLKDLKKEKNQNKRLPQKRICQVNE